MLPTATHNRVTGDCARGCQAAGGSVSQQLDLIHTWLGTGCHSGLGAVLTGPTSYLLAQCFSASALQAFARGMSMLMLVERSILKLVSSFLQASLILAPLCPACPSHRQLTSQAICQAPLPRFHCCAPLVQLLLTWTCAGTHCELQQGRNLQEACTSPARSHCDCPDTGYVHHTDCQPGQPGSEPQMLMPKHRWARLTHGLCCRVHPY